MKQLNCTYCQKSFSRDYNKNSRNKSGNQFCSRTCSAIFNNKTAKKRKLKNMCRMCQSFILSNRTYCNTCYVSKNYLSHKTLAEAIKNRKDSNRYTGIRGNGRNVFYSSKKPLICQFCHYSKHVEICHIKEICSFSPDTLISEINKIDNLMSLCPNHHWEFDNGFLSIDEIIGSVGFEPTFHPL